MNKIRLIILLILLSFATASAQIGINTENPDPSAVLDIVSDSRGILIPRMTTVQKLAIESPSEGLMVYDSDQNCISIYTFLKSTATLDWTCLTSFSDSFFYMPSINIDTSVLENGLSLNLYDQYKTQFSDVLNLSSSAPAITTYGSDNLYYYVTYYDPSKIKINSISATGVMNYDVIGHANYDSYMNVIFVVK